MMSRIILSFSLGMLLLGSVPAMAQPDDMPDGRGRRRIEELRRVRMMEALDLTEEQSIRLFAREKDLRQQEQTLGDRRKAAIERLRVLSKSSGQDAEIQSEIDKIVAVGIELVQKRRDYAQSLKDILSMQQIARLIVFEDEFREELRRILQDMRQRGRR